MTFCETQGRDTPSLNTWACSHPTMAQSSAAGLTSTFRCSGNEEPGCEALPITYLVTTVNKSLGNKLQTELILRGFLPKGQTTELLGFLLSNSLENLAGIKAYYSKSTLYPKPPRPLHFLPPHGGCSQKGG